MDYAFCQALARNSFTPKAIGIYDIICSWSKNFLWRVSQSSTLDLREDLELLYGIGKFHLGAHIQECFPLYSLNFIQGAGQIDGEILETLWANLNKVASSTSTMSQAHRQEVLDNYMNDSNWKKLIKSGMILMCLNKCFSNVCSSIYC
jgi:Kyakuja-Dileera-Zisupton transposase